MKSSNWITNLALFFLVIVLSVLTYKTNQQKIIDNTVAPLTKLNIATVSRIQINKQNRVTLIEKNNNVWRMTQPISVKANKFRIGSLLKLLTTNNYTQYDISDLDLAQFGLLDSTLNVQVDDINIVFGNINPINNKRYLLINNSMYLTDDNFFPLVNSQIGTLVDQKILADDIEITKIETDDFTLSKGDNNRWSSDSDLSPDDIVSIITHWKNAQAFGVHTYIERETLGEVVISFNAEVRAITFVITDKEPWLIIARPDLNLEYHFDDEMIAKLFFNQPEHKTDINP